MGLAQQHAVAPALNLAFDSLARLGGAEPGLFQPLLRGRVRRENHLPERELGGGGSAGVTRLIVEGWAARGRVLSDGRRQIFNFLVPGDVVVSRPRSATLPGAAVVALTLVETIDLGALCLSGGGHAGLAACLARARDAASAREDELLLDQIVRLGQQNAMQRCAHLLLELRSRLAQVGLASADSYSLPLKQEHIGEALGMTHVHLNRTLQRLRAEGFIALKNGRVTLLSIGRLSRLAQQDVADDGSVGDAFGSGGQGSGARPAPRSERAGPVAAW